MSDSKIFQSLWVATEKDLAPYVFKFYSRIKFLPGVLPRFCFPAGYLPESGRRIFLGGILTGKYRFLDRILAAILDGNFSQKVSCQENVQSRWDPTEILASAGNLGRIPVGSQVNFTRVVERSDYEYSLSSMGGTLVHQRITL